MFTFIKCRWDVGLETYKRKKFFFFSRRDILCLPCDFRLLKLLRNKYCSTYVTHLPTLPSPSFIQWTSECCGFLDNYEDSCHLPLTPLALGSPLSSTVYQWKLSLCRWLSFESFLRVFILVPRVTGFRRSSISVVSDWSDMDSSKIPGFAPLRPYLFFSV